MWWITVPGDRDVPIAGYTASGTGGQRLTVFPDFRTVVVHMMNTDDRQGPRIGTTTYNSLLRKLLVARLDEPARGSGA
jgi:hypothetical protein